MDTKKVTVLTTNGRRHNISVNQNITLLQILEQTCEKYGFNSEEHGLKHHNKEMDLTLMFRFSGLPNNCLLELFKTDKIRVEQNVNLCIQLEDGQRSQGTFLPSEDLYHILQTLCTDWIKVNLNPVVIYMRRDIFGDDLKKTNLKALGITSGRALIRVINKNPEDLKKQASVYKPHTVKEPSNKEQESLKSDTKSYDTASSSFSMTKDVIQNLKEKKSVEKMETDSKANVDSEIISNSSISETKPKYDWGPGSGRAVASTEQNEEIEAVINDMDMTDEPFIYELGERNALLFSMEAFQKSFDEFPDSFYELNVNDLKLVLRDLKSISSGNEDAPLLTAKLRELEADKKVLRKIGTYQTCVIRVQFPNRLVLQGIFKPVEKVQDVYNFVRQYLKDYNSKFELFTIPPKNVLPFDKTLLEVDCVPTALLYFALENPDPNEKTEYVQDDLLFKLTSPEGAYLSASKSSILNRNLHGKPSLSMSTTESKESNNPEEKEVRPTKSTGAIPKRPKTDNFKNSSTSSATSEQAPKWFWTKK